MFSQPDSGRRKMRSQGPSYPYYCLQCQVSYMEITYPEPHQHLYSYTSSWYALTSSHNPEHLFKHLLYSLNQVDLSPHPFLSSLPSFPSSLSSFIPPPPFCLCLSTPSLITCWLWLNERCSFFNEVEGQYFHSQSGVLCI